MSISGNLKSLGGGRAFYLFLSATLREHSSLGGGGGGRGRERRGKRNGGGKVRRGRGRTLEKLRGQDERSG